MLGRRHSIELIEINAPCWWVNFNVRRSGIWCIYKICCVNKCQRQIWLLWKSLSFGDVNGRKKLVTATNIYLYVIYDLSQNVRIKIELKLVQIHSTPTEHSILLQSNHSTSIRLEWMQCRCRYRPIFRSTPPKTYKKKFTFIFVKFEFANFSRASTNRNRP